jgi:uncharacterized protein YqjF (DUF2071 family)
MHLLDHTDHRPFPPSAGAWVMHQAWNDFLFQHWRVEASALRHLVPAALPLDTFQGHCYLGIIPFHMSDVRARGTVNLPGISAFPELNVRTYVRLNGRPGVFFLSLEAHNRLAVETARLTYDLPYFKATMDHRRSDGWNAYHSVRTDGRGPAAELKGRYRPVGPYRYAEKGTLEHWLSERYCLYTASGNTVHTTDVHHLPWPMRDAEAEWSVNTMAASHGIDLGDQAPILSMSPGVDVLVWAPRAL